MTNSKCPWIALTALGALAHASTDGASPTGTITEWHSRRQRTQVIELFTSEGCSSCPPAEKWLSGLIEQPGLWREYIPVAWHVDYWDSLGWPDPWASPGHTARQNHYATRWEKGNIYTPEFVLNGREWTSWHHAGKPPTALPTDVGVLDLQTQNGRDFTLHYRPVVAGSRTFVGCVAWLGCGIDSDVRRGENAGHRLRHHFVALSTARGSLNETDGAFSLTLTGPPPAGTHAQRLAVAAWVTHRSDPEPIQAVGGWWVPPQELSSPATGNP